MNKVEVVEITVYAWECKCGMNNVCDSGFGSITEVICDNCGEVFEVGEVE